MKGTFLMLSCFFLLFQIGWGQICDDFTDQNFSENPSWFGNETDFVVNANSELQLNAPEAGSSYLSLDVNIPAMAQWDFAIKMDFAPSTSNQLKMYLAADQADLINANGYFLEIGASGSDDPITMYRQDAGTKVKIGESDPGLAGSEPVAIRFRITRNASGQWNIDGDLSGGNNLMPLFTTLDNDHLLNGNQWFGFHCKYTATRVDKFFFDDICLGEPVVDMSPPQLLNTNILSSLAVELLFDENLSAAAENPANYSLNPGNVQPSSVNLLQNKVTLVFDMGFESGTEYTLALQNIADLANNVATNFSTQFTYTEVVQVSKYDLLINEIMADPSPIVSLPDAEYLEIYHNGLLSIDLNSVRLLVGNSSLILPEHIMNPGDYVILTDIDQASNFETYGTVIPVQLPSLINSGTTIQLLNDIGNEIHSISYQSSWYQDSNKDDGGWSLELKNPLNLCFQSENWSASRDLRGGTPGEENSIIEVEPDVLGPELVSAQPESTSTILVSFNEEITDQFLSASSFMIVPERAVITAIKTAAHSLELTLTEPILEGVVYTLEVLSVSDCQENLATTTQAIEFGLPVLPQKGELIINELLFNPATGGVRFVELMNVTKKVLTTEGLIIGEITDQETDLESVSTRHLILPNSLVVITPNPEDIKARYTVPFPNNVIESKLPSWTAAEGNVTILYNGITLDSFDYSEQYHSSLLDDEKGVSLERVSPILDTNQPDVWHSASQDVGFATPTGTNSQVLTIFAENKEFELINSTFSPDQDGFKDFLGIQFITPAEETIASVSIYDASGRLVRNLVKSESVSRTPFMKWDGTDEDGQLNRVGIYIVFIDLFSPTGITKQYKESCVLARKLN